MNEFPESKNERLPLIGAVLAGGLASACCIGPLVVVLLGLGSASVFIAMEPYRPFFAAMTLVFLGWAGWRHWQGRKVSAATECNLKPPVMLWLLSALAIFLLVSPSLIPYLLR